MRNMKLRFKLKEARDHIRERDDSGEPINSTHSDNERQSPHVPANAQFPRRSEVLTLHRIKSDFYRRRQLEALLFFLAAWFVLWLISAVIFRRSERSQGWSYFAALYFTYTLLTTIGYGDLYPTSNFGKAFFVFWSLLAIPVLTNLVTAMGEIGLRALIYFSGYMWRLGSSRAHARQCQRHGIVPQPHGERSSNRVITSASDPEPLDSGTDIGRHAEGPPMTRQSLRTCVSFCLLKKWKSSWLLLWMNPSGRTYIAIGLEFSHCSTLGRMRGPTHWSPHPLQSCINSRRGSS